MYVLYPGKKPNEITSHHWLWFGREFPSNELNFDFIARIVLLNEGTNRQAKAIPRMVFVANL